MKKKGFTLVELLAVIAILAILVIVAMPNVLGMFNQAKSSTFTTETQTLMDTASTAFMTKALTSQGQTLYFSNDSTTQTALGASALDMDGATKNYFVEMNRNGEFVRVVVYDDNFCYDASTGNQNAKGSTSTKTHTYNPIEKTTVKVTDVVERETNDSVTASKDASGNITVVGCTGTVKAQ